MKKHILIFSAAIIILSLLCLPGCGSKTKAPENAAKNGTFSVVSSFYPMHILALNLTQGIEGVTETSMSAPDICCIHDHTFTVSDLRKIEGASVYIENGLGLEAFNDKLKNAYPHMPVIEAAKDIEDVELEPHVWTNIDYYIMEVRRVSLELQSLDPAHGDAYAANERAYIEKLEKLKSDYRSTIAASCGKKVLVLDENLPNLCEFLKMDVTEIETDHEQESFSADDLKQTIGKMRREGIDTIIIAKGANRAIAESIADETGAAIYELDPCMNGSENDDSDAYIRAMSGNLEIIASIVSKR